MAQPVLTRIDRHATARWMVVAGLCIVLLAPLLIVDVPPLLDYPNHLARVFVLASLPHDPVLARFYAAHWSIIPNLALDLVAPPLLLVLPVHVVGRLLIALAVLLPVLGTIAYGRALGGRWWSLGVGLIAYNGCLLSGFLNFQIALGLALLLAAAWLRWRESRPVGMVALAAAGGVVLFACHLMGLAFFGVLISGAELDRVWAERAAGGAVRLGAVQPHAIRLGASWLGTVWREAVWRGAVLALVFAAPALLYSLSALQVLGGDAGFLPPGAKLLQLTATFVTYDWTLDMIAAGVAVGVPVVCLTMGWGRVPGPAAVAMWLLAGIYLAAPFAWKGTYALDTRFATMLGFMLFAGFVPGRWPAWFGRAVTVTLLVVLVARMGLLATAWAAHRTDIADLRTVLEPVRPGSAVYVAEAALQEAPGYWAANPGWRLLSNGARTDEHLGALALIERRAYWPFQFDAPSQQPIETREPYRSLAQKVGHLPDRAEVVAADVCGFDYVLLLEADSVRALPADRFRLLVQAGFAALYEVTRCAGAG